MNHGVELIASYWTIAGTLPVGDREYSPHGFRERAEAVAKAGFAGMGIWHSDLERLLVSSSLADMRRILDDNGVARVELEFLVDWFLAGERKKASDIRKNLLFEAAEALGARYVKVGDFFNEECPMPKLIECFASLCEDASEHGVGIVFEPMAAAMIHSLEDSVEMVAGAGAANGGLALDLWHMVNQAISYDEISRLPGKYLFAVELNDAEIRRNAEPNRRAGDPRKLCGEGDFDIRGFIEAIKKTGYSGPWGVEVISPAVARMPLGEAAGKAFATTMAMFGS